MNADPVVEQIDVLHLVVTLSGGLALFLFGIDQMTDSLKSVAGDNLKLLLSRLSMNRWKAVFTGAFVTAVIQSSAITTVLVVGFISAGLLTLPQAAGIIMGANIGTTITAQVIAFKITQYSLPLIAIGFVFHLLSKTGSGKRIGLIVMGLGLIFLGMDYMGTATGPLKTYSPFIEWMKEMDKPLLGILTGMVGTAIVQSSSVTTGIVIVLAGQGFMTLEAGIALIFGANIGSCATALIASIGKPRPALQAAVVHVLFNVLGVLIWVAFIPHLADVVRWMSPHESSLVGLDKLAVETPRQIANAHTLFNVLNTFLFIGFVRPMAHAVEILLPVKPRREPDLVQPRFLNRDSLQTPSLALSLVRMELGHVGERIMNMMQLISSALVRGDENDLNRIVQLDNEIDGLHKSIIDYMRGLSVQRLSEIEAREVHQLINIATYLENMGDVIETNMVAGGLKRIRHRFTFDEQTRAGLDRLVRRITALVDDTVRSVTESNPALAARVIEAKTDVNRISDDVLEGVLKRFDSGNITDPSEFRLLTDIVDHWKRIYYIGKRIAKVVESSAA